jgi:transposase-like protein
MSKSTISTFELFDLFPDEESARVYLEARLWPTGTVCPTCQAQDRITTRANGYYRCNACQLDFTVRTGTIFERSHVPLHKWVYSMYLLVTARKGISSLQLAKEIGVTQKTAWFVLGRLREACGGQIEKLRGTVQNEIHGAVEAGSQLYTDEFGAYTDLDGLFFRHDTVNHSAGEFVRGHAHTNGIESVWAVLKRGLHGVYHHASAKHLFRYVDEFTFRLNEGNVARHSLRRLDSFVDATKGKRLTYRRLCR